MNRLNFKQGVAVGVIIATELQKLRLYAGMQARNPTAHADIKTQAAQLLATAKAAYGKAISQEFPDGIPDAAFEAAYGTIVELLMEM